MEEVSTSLPHREGQRESLTIVKVGGAVVEDEAQLAQLLKDFTAIKGAKILVHGGGRRATKVAAELGIETKMVNGRRITDAAMLEVVTMVYGGLVNKHVVALLQAQGVDAIGLTGADADILRSTKRPPLVVDGSPLVVDGSPLAVDGSPLAVDGSPLAVDGSPLAVDGSPVDFGYVGDVKKADGAKIAHFIGAGLVPVIAPLTHDGQGNILNTNADTMASETAKAMAALYDVTLIYAFEKPGVMRNPDDDSSLIPVITRPDFERYKADGTISGGMLPKIENALAAVEAGVGRVIITLATAIDGQHGTVITE